MRRRLLVPLSVLSLLLVVACGDDGGDGSASTDTVVTTTTSPTVSFVLTPLEVHLDDPGAEPREPLVQRLHEGASSDGDLEFSLDIETVATARAVGQTTLTVGAVDDDGNAEVHYTLDDLDLTVSTDASAGETTPDALSVSGDLTVAPDRSGTQTATAQVDSTGSVPGAENIATSLDPRLAFLLFPFPEDPVGLGASWTISGPIPLFNSTVELRAQVELIERRGNHYVLTVTTAMASTPSSSMEISLQGLGRIQGDLGRLGVGESAIGLDGTAVLVDRGPDPLPMTLELHVAPHEAGAGEDGTS